MAASIDAIEEMLNEGDKTQLMSELALPVDWHILGKQLLYSLILHGFIVGGTIPLGYLYRQRRFRAIKLGIQSWVGRNEDVGRHKGFIFSLQVVQWSFSLLTVVFWIVKVYTHHVPVAMHICELICAGFFLFDYLCSVLKYVLTTVDHYLDALTIVPILLQRGPVESWLSFSFVRVIHMLHAYERLDSSGALYDVSEFTRGMIVIALRFNSMIVCMAATMYILETLGDIDSLHDLYLAAAGGDVSFSQMCYFIMVTISTVGYGDYSPATFLGRWVIIGFIIIGVVFFSMESANILKLKALEATGNGSFVIRNKHKYHVLVCGGAITGGNVVVLRNFLAELLHPNYGERAPDVCVMGRIDTDDPAMGDLRPLMKEPWCRGKVQFLSGSPMLQKDLKRARIERCKMCFILADISTKYLDSEDEQNVMRAAAVKQLYPRMPMRLMLLRPESKQLAINVGLEALSCYALNEVKANLMAQNCRNLGIATLIVNLLRQDAHTGLAQEANMTGEEGSVEFPGAGGATPGWHTEYLDGFSREVYGVVLKEEFAGRSFLEAARAVYDNSGVQLLGVQTPEGSIKVNPGPSYKLNKDDVVFVIASDDDMVAKVQNIGPDIDWRENFMRRRSNTQHDRDEAIKIESERFDLGGKLAEGQEQRTSRTSGGPEGVKLPIQLAAASRAKEGRRIAPAKITMRQSGGGSSAASAVVAESVVLSDDDDDGVDDEMKRIERRKLEKIVTDGGHIVVVAIGENMWQQVIAMLRPLRADYLPTIQPVVVISSAPPPKKLRDMAFEAVSFVSGAPSRLKTLNRAGVALADRVVALCGPPPPVDVLLLDSKVLLLIQQMEFQHRAWGRQVFMCSELCNPDSLRMLDAEIPKGGERKKRFNREGGDENQKSASLDLHPRYAGGRILNRTDICRLYASAYYTPGTMEILEALTIPSQRQQLAMTWSVAVPATHEERPYRELVNTLNEQGGISLGLFRAPNVALGNQLPYLYTVPPGDAVLHAKDRVYVLAPPQWAREYGGYEDQGRIDEEGSEEGSKGEGGESEDGGSEGGGEGPGQLGDLSSLAFAGLEVAPLAEQQRSNKVVPV